MISLGRSLLPSFLLLALWLVPSVSAQTSSARAPSQGDGVEACDFYQDWLEAQIPCGPKGYALGYGLHYCRRYMNRLDRFSDRGAIWVEGVMRCLQTALRGYLADHSGAAPGCEEIKLAAFDSHPACYTEGEVSFCELKARDYWQISRILSPKDLFSRLGLRQIKSVARVCLVARRAVSAFVQDEEARDAERALEAILKLAGEDEAPRSSVHGLVGTEPVPETPVR